MNGINKNNICTMLREMKNPEILDYLLDNNVIKNEMVIRRNISVNTEDFVAEWLIEHPEYIDWQMIQLNKNWKLVKYLLEEHPEKIDFDHKSIYQNTNAMVYNFMEANVDLVNFTVIIADRCIGLYQLCNEHLDKVKWDKVRTIDYLQFLDVLEQFGNIR